MQNVGTARTEWDVRSGTAAIEKPLRFLDAHLRHGRLLAVIVAALCLFSFPGAVPAQALDHQAWDTMLRQYVSSEGRVDYARWKERDLPALQQYVDRLAKPWPETLSPAEDKAARINAYNALTIRWILAHYPVESIWQTPDPFKGVQHQVAGGKTSLDAFEAGLRRGGDPRIHAVLVCAALSCPPLQNEAYRAEVLDEQLDDAARRWLASSHLNRFSLNVRVAELSPILKWYAEDFAATGGVKAFVARYAPPTVKGSFSAEPWEIRYGGYDWGLNDSSGLGAAYNQAKEGVDRARGGDLWGKVKDWFLSLGAQYGVDPVIFGAIYVGAIPLFSLCIGWLIRNVKKKRSPVVPAMLAALCFVSAYLYLLVVGNNIPVWVYIFLGSLIAFGLVSTIRKVRAGLQTR